MWCNTRLIWSCLCLHVFDAVLGRVKSLLSTMLLVMSYHYNSLLNRYLCIVDARVINVAYVWSCKQVEEMVILHLFIDYHYKSIVSTIRERHVLTLHLSTANWKKAHWQLLQEHGCILLHMLCNFYQIESIPQFLELWSTFNAN